MEVRWHSRGYLPHFDGGERAQFVTFRLGDSLPRSVLERWRSELENAGEGEREIELYRRIEWYLDQGYGAAYMKDERVAGLVQDALLHRDGECYRLAAWCVMPNHVHFLAAPCADQSLSTIMKSLKSYTSHQANEVLKRRGRFWMEDYFDRYMRNTEHYFKTVAYIENNPVKARLCARPHDWRWSSAHAKFRDTDGRTGSADGPSA